MAKRGNQLPPRFDYLEKALLPAQLLEFLELPAFSKRWKEMGLDDEAVVDERLRVRGVSGVRVVDTSILPFLVAGNTAAPAMAMAWRAADLILADANLPTGIRAAA